MLIEREVDRDLVLLACGPNSVVANGVAAEKGSEREEEKERKEREEKGNRKNQHNKLLVVVRFGLMRESPKKSKTLRKTALEKDGTDRLLVLCMRPSAAPIFLTSTE